MKEKKAKSNTNTGKIVLTLGISFLSFIILFSSLTTPQENNTQIAYQIEQKIKPQVYLYPNDFIQESVLEEDKTYIAEIIKYIAITFPYQCQLSQYGNVKVEYDILSTLKIDYATGNQNLVQENQSIVQGQSKELTQGRVLSFQEEITLPFQEYRTKIAKFKEQFNLPIKAYLTIAFVVTTQMEQEKRQTTQEITIDLNQPVFEIGQQSLGDSRSGNLQNQNEVSKRKYLPAISTITLLCSLFFFLLEIKNNVFAKKSIYELELTHLLKKYTDIIVEVKEEVTFEDVQYIEVKDFNELLDVEEEIREPILFYEKEDTAIFLILHGKIVYRCKISDKN